jgi:mRNA-degrading endonuclease toxin of MazEF toxin-antitoxin module
MAITTINIGAAPNDHTGDTIRDSFDICNLNFQDLDTTKFDIPTGLVTEYLNGEGTPTTFPTLATADTLITEVYNQTGGTLLRGSIVYISGAHGNLPKVSPSLATSDATSAQTLGMVQDDISNNDNGFVVVAGKLGNLDTFAIAEGTQLYLSSITAGFYTTTKQFAPNHLVYIGVVVRAHPTQGVIEVKIQNGYELDEIHDVFAQTPVNRDLLMYNSATQLWQNTSFYNRVMSGVQYFTDFDSSFTLDKLQSVVSLGTTIRFNAIIANQSSNQIGICTYATSTGATNYAMHISESNSAGQQFQFGGGTWVYESYIAVETLSDVTNRFRFQTGFGDLATASNDNNGAIIIYDEGGTANGTIASANWQCVTSNNGLRTLTTTSVPVTTNWVKLKIIVNAAATQITYFIDGSLVATHITTIPTYALGRRFKVKQGIFKTIGTTNRNVNCDYLFYENNLTTLR